MKKTCSFFIILCFSIFITACGQEQQGVTKAPAVGKPAPDFTLVDLQGKTWTLSALKGQVVFLNFWATWCPPCVNEMPSMQNLYTMLPKDQFKMLAVLNNDDPAVAKDFSEKFGITIPILPDRNNQVGPLYGLTGIPETFIIDKQGIIRKKVIGPAHWDAPDEFQSILNYINQ
ncbi:MAG: TlpA family protein disulfide reductase [Candidatus Electrothrix sp. AR4]|nr:TlpA family protein disulfide reductase [Candidatus Electrothrix sp. AR4]